ncbi:chromatin remodeling complex subunit [Microthyrium microscopicum]|uniref:Chromatin remodeling complex subunit n=1 Tax=Microthyrium microscopicum TaxID=703497 RepID=A0A6A6TVB5_9PEZI|nr:chromatin remodeling complex subunit [Microthyrium microscopicum]
MAGKPKGKSGKAQQREEGLEKTDNNLPLTSWPQVPMINQKNYYTEYLKREDQYLAYRTLQEENTNRMVREARDKDRALAQGNGVPMANGNGAADNDEDMMDVDDSSEIHGSKIIVIHPGSQNLRIGFANDAIPKTVPMVVARRWKENESEENGGEPLPKRVKIDGEVPEEPEKQFGEEFASMCNTLSADLKARLRYKKIRLMPNSKELVVNYNRRSTPEMITEHNDPHRIEWTEIPARNPPDCITGAAALRIPENSKPRYKLFWPIKNGWLNEKDYKQKNMVLNDYFLVIEDAMKKELGVTRKKDLQQYSCVFVIPDLYEKVLVQTALEEFMRDFGFRRICFMQESLAASFGASYTMTCIVDVGAEKTSICCVEDGMCIEDSRINMKYGGRDVTEFYIKKLIHSHFPYSDINLKRRYDFLLAEELKQKFLSMNETDVVGNTYEFHLRAAGQDTRKYSFRVYDEIILPGIGYFDPSRFNFEGKLDGRRSIVDRSYDLYDNSPNDPTSAAQAMVLQWATQNIPSATIQVAESSTKPTATPAITATPQRDRPLNLLSRLQEMDGTPRSSAANSPAPEGTPQPRQGSPSGDATGANGTRPEPIDDRLRIAEESDRILPIMPLDEAIIVSIRQAARSDDRKMRDFLGGVMLVGGGCKMPGFNTFLEDRLRTILPGMAKEIMVGLPPRELDQQLVAWKGGSVFGRLSSSGNDSWVYQKEYDILGSKLLVQKLMFAY